MNNIHMNVKVNWMKVFCPTCHKDDIKTYLNAFCCFWCWTYMDKKTGEKLDLTKIIECPVCFWSIERKDWRITCVSCWEIIK